MPLEIAKREGRDDIVELLDDYIKIIMLQRKLRQKSKRSFRKTHQSKQRLSLAKGLVDKGSIIDRYFKYEPHIIEKISDTLRLNQGAIDRSIKEQQDEEWVRRFEKALAIDRSNR